MIEVSGFPLSAIWEGTWGFSSPSRMTTVCFGIFVWCFGVRWLLYFLGEEETWGINHEEMRMMDYGFIMSKTIEGLFRRQHIGTCLLEFEKWKYQFQLRFFFFPTGRKVCFTTYLSQAKVNSRETYSFLTCLDL